MNSTEKPESVVYFAAGREHIKIGVTRNLKIRFQSLQTSSAEDLTLLGSVRGGVGLEKMLHSRLAAFRHRGEWFADCDEVRLAVNEICLRNVFGERPVPKMSQPERISTKPSPEQIDREILDNMRDRMVSFLDFFVGSGVHGHLSPMGLLPSEHRHLAVAAMKYAQSGYETARASYLYDNLGKDEAESALMRALSFASLLECHLELICGEEFKELLEGWNSKFILTPEA